MLLEADKIIHSKRRSLSLEITSDARLIVRAPLRVGREKILEILRKKENWIRRKRQQAEQKRNEVIPKIFKDGELFFFLGQEYPLKITEKILPALDLNGKFFLAKKHLPNAQTLFEKWYRNEAKIILSEKTRIFADQLGVSITSVKITGAKKRWGSCTTKGNINFSWRLVLAPESIVNYVVAHEIAHRKEMNHSARFWKIVALLYPEYQTARKWLRENGHLVMA